MLLLANLAYKSNAKPLKMTATLVYGYSFKGTQRARTNQWIPTWQGFRKSLRPCSLNEIRLSIGRVNSSYQLDTVDEWLWSYLHVFGCWAKCQEAPFLWKAVLSGEIYRRIYPIIILIFCCPQNRRGSFPKYHYWPTNACTTILLFKDPCTARSLSDTTVK